MYPKYKHHQTHKNIYHICKQKYSHKLLLCVPFIYMHNKEVVEANGRYTDNYDRLYDWKRNAIFTTIYFGSGRETTILD